MRLRALTEKLVVETFSVVLGILLALAANSWHDSSVHGAEAQDAMVSIRNEIAANRASLADRIGYHSAMHDSIDALIKRTHGASAPEGLLAIKGWNGISPPRLVDNAWQTASVTGALQYMPVAKVLSLSRVYSLQQRVTDIQRAFFSVVYTPQFATGGVSAIASMGNFLGDLTANERQLLVQYDSALAAPGPAARR